LFPFQFAGLASLGEPFDSSPQEPYLCGVGLRHESDKGFRMTFRARISGGRSVVAAPAVLALSMFLGSIAGCGDSDGGGDAGVGGKTGSGGSAGSGGASGAGKGGSGGSGGTAGSGGSGASAGAGGKGGSGGKGGTASGGSDSGGMGGGGTGGEVDRTETSMPDADIEGSGGTIVDNDGETVDSNGSGWVTVLSSHYYTEVEADLGLVERWLVLVENSGGYRVCNVTVNASFRDEDGGEIAQVSADVSSKTYALESGDGPVFCLEAGERAIGAGFMYPTEPLDPATVAEVRYEIFGVAIPNVERKDWATVENAELADQGDNKVVRGTLKNGEDELGWWQVRVFALGNDGVPLRAQDLSPGDATVEPGAEWSFESEAFALPEMQDYAYVVDHGPPS
jgi:hypothetical protein